MRFAYLTPTSAIELSAPACREPGGGFDRCPRLRGHCRPQPGTARASLGAGAPALRPVAGTAGADHNGIRHEPILADTPWPQALVSDGIRQPARILHTGGHHPDPLLAGCRWTSRDASTMKCSSASSASCARSPSSVAVDARCSSLVTW